MFNWIRANEVRAANLIKHNTALGILSTFQGELTVAGDEGSVLSLNQLRQCNVNWVKLHTDATFHSGAVFNLIRIKTSECRERVFYSFELN